MPRTKIITSRTRVNVWMMNSQIKQLERFKQLYGKSKTDIIAEALQFWFNTQEQLHGQQLKELEQKEADHAVPVDKT